MKENMIKLINLKINVLEQQLKDLYDTDSKQHSIYIQLESKIEVLKDLIEDINTFSKQ
jgi:hypothetical protein